VSRRSTVGGTRIGGGGDARRTRKIDTVNCYGHAVKRGHAFVVIVALHRYGVDRGDVGGGREKRNVTVLAHFVFANFHPAHHRSQNVLCRTTQFVNTILYLQTIAIEWNGVLPNENT